jgi:hypothetical protein
MFGSYEHRDKRDSPDNQCEYIHPESWFLKIAFFLFGCGLITWGWWNISTIARRVRWVAGHGILGIALIFAGFCALGFGLNGLLFAENASVLGASATCYSRAELPRWHCDSQAALYARRN